jgi:ABC-type sugar transport system ATPase subunit
MTEYTALESAINLVHVSKRYGDNLAVNGFTAAMAPGDFVVLLGPSGCGKSTILKMIAGLEDVTEGEIYIAGELANYIPPKNRDVAMVFQNYALYPHMMVSRNLAFPLKMRGVDQARIRKRVDEVSSLLELSSLLDRFPDELSGGERQRVALGRAIIRDPVAFLMDEPLSNLDALLRFQMRDELLKLHKRVGRTTIYVTHDQIEAMAMADSVIVLKDGRIQQVGNPQDVYDRPANTFVATFIGSPPMNLLRGRTEIGRHGLMFTWRDHRIPLDNGSIPVATESILGVRAEDAELTQDSGDGVLRGVVGLVEPVGADKFVRVEIDVDVYWYVRVSSVTDVREGEAIGVRISGDRYHLYDREGNLYSRESGAGVTTPSDS